MFGSAFLLIEKKRLFSSLTFCHNNSLSSLIPPPVTVRCWKETEKSRFISGADPWLIASAMHHDLVVVTQDVLVPADSQKIKIPNICVEFDVECINIFDLIRIEKVSFKLG